MHWEAVIQNACINPLPLRRVPLLGVSSVAMATVKNWIVCGATSITRPTWYTVALMLSQYEPIVHTCVVIHLKSWIINSYKKKKGGVERKICCFFPFCSSATLYQCRGWRTWLAASFGFSWITSVTSEFVLNLNAYWWRGPSGRTSPTYWVRIKVSCVKDDLRDVLRESKHLCVSPGRPRSLQHLCRLVIRGHMSLRTLNDHKAMAAVPFPPALKNYLTYREYRPYSDLISMWNILCI